MASRSRARALDTSALTCLARLPIPGTLLLLAVATCLAQAQPASTEGRCAEVVTLATHDGSTTRYAFSSPSGGDSAAVPITLVLLPGGPGYVALDDGGCPQKLKGNSLVRSLPAFAAQGLATALIDAPSDYQGADGLGGFRTAAEHADDLGQVIASLRRRTGGKVWVVGTSRGSISAANAAARLSGGSAPDGVVLTSALMSGQTAAKKRWVAQTVFDLPLESIRLPLLVVGHADDRCVRSPPALMAQVAARTRSSRQEVVSVTGGSGASGLDGLDACEANAAHGFIGQESELAAGIARFVRGSDYQER